MHFRKGDVIPGEGVVVTHASGPMLLAGLAMLTVGIGIAALSATCNQSDESSGFFSFPPRFGCQFGLGALGTSFIFPGLVLLIGGAGEHPYITHPKAAAVRVEVLPSLSPHDVGGTLQLRF